MRFCDEVPKTGELRVLGRGDRSVIETLPGAPLANDYSMNVADICPVGALTTKDFRFKIRVWFLDDVPGVCTARHAATFTRVANTASTVTPAQRRGERPWIATRPLSYSARLGRPP